MCWRGGNPEEERCQSRKKTRVTRSVRGAGEESRYTHLEGDVVLDTVSFVLTEKCLDVVGEGDREGDLGAERLLPRTQEGIRAKRRNADGLDDVAS